MTYMIEDTTNTIKSVSYHDLHIKYEIEDTTYTIKSVSYLDLHLEVDNKGRLKTKLYDKTDDFSL